MHEGIKVLVREWLTVCKLKPLIVILNSKFFEHLAEHVAYAASGTNYPTCLASASES